MLCCENSAVMCKTDLYDCFDVIKEYDPKPKNPDGSTRFYLYRWDDGKDGYRLLVRCKECGKFFLVQRYKLSKFTENPDMIYEDWYDVVSENEADRLNRSLTGPQLEKERTPVLRIAGESIG